MSNRLLQAGLAIAICLMAMPVAFVATIVAFPFWRWIEARFKIESVGHSGPAEWCYWTSYIVILVCAAILWRGISRRTRHDGPAGKGGVED